jgi:CRP-like cAMP-binding protein
MDLVPVLQQTDLFKGVDREALEALIASMSHFELPAHYRLFSEGDPGDAMYIILGGRVRIFSEVTAGQTVTLMHYQTGQIFGEFSLIDSKPRSASAEAVEALNVLRLERDDFLAFLQNRPNVSLEMMRTLAERARYTTAYLQEVVKWAQRLAKGEYFQAIQDIEHKKDTSNLQILELVMTFLNMVKNVQKREDELRERLVEVQVEIDQEKRRTSVAEITKSGFFTTLKAQARQMREQVSSYSTPHEELPP